MFNVDWPCILSKGYDDIPSPISFNRVCSPRATSAFHIRLHFTVCAVQRRWWHTMPDVVHLCVYYKSDDVMPRSMSSYIVYCAKVMMTCHTRCRTIVCAVQGVWYHPMHDVVHPCVLSNGDDGMPRRTFLICVSTTRAIIVFHDRRRPAVCVVQSLWWHAKPDIVWPCMLLKVNDGMPLSTSSDSLYYPIATRACHARCRFTVCAFQGTWLHAKPDIVGPWFFCRYRTTINHCICK